MDSMSISLPCKDNVFNVIAFACLDKKRNNEVPSKWLPDLPIPPTLSFKDDNKDSEEVDVVVDKVGDFLLSLSVDGVMDVSNRWMTEGMSIGHDSTCSSSR